MIIMYFLIIIDNLHVNKALTAPFNTNFLAGAPTAGILGPYNKVTAGCMCLRCVQLWLNNINQLLPYRGYISDQILII